MKYKLLPHTREKIYGFNRDAGQVLGWEISKFDIPKYWDKATGKNIRVAVLDTGCDINHEDLKSNIAEGYNSIDNNSNFMDDNGHGTHVAGTIAAADNKSGMVGVAPESTIVPIKALNSKGSASADSIARGIVWAANNNCNIITMSLGSKQNSQLISNAINYANTKGVVVVCAAGNDGNSNSIMYPARLSSTIAIGSIGSSMTYSSFSCTGPELDFVSPGENIFSCKPNNSYGIMSGTSMATPFAVGCIALTLSHYNKQNMSIITTHENIIEKFKLYSIKINHNNNTYNLIRPGIEL